MSIHIQTLLTAASKAVDNKGKLEITELIKEINNIEEIDFKVLVREEMTLEFDDVDMLFDDMRQTSYDMGVIDSAKRHKEIMWNTEQKHNQQLKELKELLEKRSQND